MPADRANRLVEHARARHEQTLHRARAALTSMADNGDAITVALLAGKAGVSRSWIYTQPELREHIEQLQQATTRPGAPPREAADHASEESLRRRLTLAINASPNYAPRISNSGNLSHVLTASCAWPERPPAEQS